MPILHLGVVDIPYVQEATSAPAAKPGLRRKAAKPRRVAVGAETTGDVATWLENKYHVMEHFYRLHEQEIADDVLMSMAGSLETAIMGGPTSNPLASAESAIDARFRKFLANKELDQLGYPGIPTRAALTGVSHRFKRKRGPPRPSFIDTGQYQASFKAWVDE